MHTNYRIRINPTNNRRNVKFNLLSTVQPATKLHKKKQMPVQLGIMILTLFLAWHCPDHVAGLFAGGITDPI